MNDKKTKTKIVPFSLKNEPALIEVLFPAQKVSAEAFKEREGRQSQTLTALGNYWKGRKPLILNKACILGALLPVTVDLRRDLEVFEMLMGMDDLSFVVRLGRIKPSDIVSRVELANILKFFDVSPPASFPNASPFDVADYAYELNGKWRLPKLSWRSDVPEKTRRRIEALALPPQNYRDRVKKSQRAEICSEDVHSHIWDEVNEHLGISVHSFPELVEQLGVMRFGRRPRVTDTFSGSGQIPFEAARLGCDAYASDLNPVACMLTWGGFNIVGASSEERKVLALGHKELIKEVQREIDALGIESDGDGWRAKVFLYCLEATCTQSGGWSVPMLPTMVVSKGWAVVARLVPDFIKKRYDIELVQNATSEQLKAAETGTIQGGYLVHSIGAQEFRTKVSTLRGDYTTPDGEMRNRLRQWGKEDIAFRKSDIFRERAYAIQWQTTVEINGKAKTISEFRAITEADEVRDKNVLDCVLANLFHWQEKGYVPDAVIEVGDETGRLSKERGWTHWHHLFNPRQLLTAALVNKYSRVGEKFALTQILNTNCRLSRWNNDAGAGRAGNAKGVFDNQALNTLYNYTCRGLCCLEGLLHGDFKESPLPNNTSATVSNLPAAKWEIESDIYITDPPYGDAVKYEEILEFFIAWQRKNPPAEFAAWVWDSRRTLAVKGEDHDFKLGMVSAYKRMAEKMPENGIQILMFTHQSSTIWADIANIVWASGLQVSAAWYVVTETDSPLREGSYVKGTVLLVLRKRKGWLSTFRDDLSIELRDEVEEQVKTLTGLNQRTKDLYRDENLFTDSDLQMAGYAAALRVLTRFAEIDGIDMTIESLRPRRKGEQTRVDRLIEYAVEIADQCLIPSGMAEIYWSRLQPAERFYLKMLDLESHKSHALDNYQSFAKAFKVREFHAMMASEKANSARLKSSAEFGRAEMSGESEIANFPLRGVLYALMELSKGTEPDDVLAHLVDNVADYYQKRDTVKAIADFLASRLPTIREDEASHARVLRDLVQNEQLA
jgi:putative DNA methylase